MTTANPVLKYKPLWLVIGYLMIAFVVQQTLTSSPMDTGIKFSDKFLHTVGYFGLMGWFVQIYHQKKMKIIGAVFFISMGISLEFLQGWSGVRQYELNDMLANAMGVVIAWLLSFTRFADVLSYAEVRLLKTKQGS